jgi:hypothetical protein
MIVYLVAGTDYMKSVPNVANKGNVSSFKHKPAAVPTKPKIAFSENSGSTSRAANAIHGPDNHEEELIVRLPSYKAPSHGLYMQPPLYHYNRYYQVLQTVIVSLF